MKAKMAKEYATEALLEDSKYKVKAIGYLSIADPPYDVGEVPNGFIEKLKQLYHTGLMMASLGFHECEFCINQGVKDLPRDALSSSEKCIRDKKNKIEYWLPEMIFHYIKVHQFKPSEEFINFIMGI